LKNKKITKSRTQFSKYFTGKDSNDPLATPRQKNKTTDLKMSTQISCIYLVGA